MTVSVLTHFGPGATEPPECCTPEPEDLPPFFDTPSGGGGPSSGGELPEGGGELELIDNLLKQTIPASLAFNAPSEMERGETITIELLLNPSLSETELAREVAEAGEVVSASVEITPQMKAEILAADEEAFTIRRIHDEPVQLVSGTETTRWAWFVTAKKEGRQQLTIVLYRLVKFEGEESWREVESYKSNIDIRVSLLGRLQSLGWGWIVGTLLMLVAIPAIWRWMDVHKKRAEPGAEPAKRSAAVVAEELGHIFLSYRRSDSADITGRIYDRLVEEFGRAPIFKDVDSIPLGTDFKQQLEQKVGQTRVLLAIIGDRWLDAMDADGRRRLDDPADYVRMEIELALERHISVIPLLVRGAQMPDVDQLPAGLKALAHRNGMPIRPDPDFHNDMDRLISALKDSM